MAEPTDTVVAQSDDWLLPTPDASDAPSPEAPPGPTSRRTIVTGAALVLAGAAVGAVVVTATSNGSSTNAAPVANIGPVPGGPVPGGPAPGGQVPGGQAPAAPGPGGLDGEQHLTGTLTAVGASTVTVRTSGGTATYAITSTAEIVRDGAVARLSQLRAGDAVFVHVYPAGSGARLTVERLFASSTT
jgi:hypothetical protein